MNSLARQTSVRTTLTPSPIAGAAGPGFVPVEVGCAATGGVHCPLLCLSWTVGSVGAEDKSLPSAEGSPCVRAKPCARPSSGAPGDPESPLAVQGAHQAHSGWRTEAEGRAHLQAGPLPLPLVPAPPSEARGTEPGGRVPGA